MRYSIAPYIYPIMVGNGCVGQGFVADGFFITAAHVVKDSPNCYIKIGDHKVMLCNYKYQYGRKVIIDITIMGIDLVEEGIYETGYYAVLDKLPFKIDELSKVEREVLDEYCTCVVHQTM